MSSPEHDPNPYAPPKAPVSDVLPETVERPPDVTLAVRLLWISLGVGVFGLFVDPDVKGGVLVVAIAMGLVGCGIGAWINFKIASGRNWARIIYLIMAIVVYALTAATWKSTVAPTRGLVSTVFNVVGAALDVWILYLLFKRSSSAWFRQQGRR